MSVQSIGKLWRFWLCTSLNTISVKDSSLWNVTPCQLEHRYRRFGDAYCLNLQG